MRARGAPGGPQLPPEGLEGVCALAFADKYHRTAEQVEYHGEIAVAFAHADLVDGDLREVLESDALEATFEMPLLDVLDHVPAHAEVMGRVLNGHARAEFEGVPLEGAGVACAWRGEADLDLPGLAARGAPDPRHVRVDEHRLAADGRGPPATPHAAFASHLAAAAAAAPQVVGRWLGSKHDAAVDEVGPPMRVAAKAPAVVQQARGHALCSFLKSLTTPEETGMSTLLQALPTREPEEPFVTFQKINGSSGIRVGSMQVHSYKAFALLNRPGQGGTRSGKSLTRPAQQTR